MLVAVLVACSSAPGPKPDDTGTLATTPVGTPTPGPTGHTGHTGDTGAAPAPLAVSGAPLGTVEPWADGDAVEVFGGPQGGWHIDFELVVTGIDSAQVTARADVQNLTTGARYEGYDVAIALLYDPVERSGHVPQRAILLPAAVTNIACEELNHPLRFELHLVEQATRLEATSAVELVPTFANGNGPIDCP